MALTQTDLDALDKAIAGAELTVSVDGKSVTYRSMNELMRARTYVAGVIASAVGNRRNIFYFTKAGSRD
jgi:hypothetical protein